MSMMKKGLSVESLLEKVPQALTYSPCRPLRQIMMMVMRMLMTMMVMMMMVMLMIIQIPASLGPKEDISYDSASTRQSLESVAVG